MMINSIVKHLKVLVKGNSPIVPIVMLISAYIIYAPALKSEFIADDVSQIVNNPYIRNITKIPDFFSGGTFYIEGAASLSGMYYRPLMMVIYCLIAVGFGVRPYYFHLFQLLLHLCNSALIFLLFYRFFKKYWLSLALAFTFLIHPVNTETVNYIANLQDVLMLFFGLISIHVVFISSISVIRKRDLLAIFVALLLCLLGKETGVIFTVIIYLALVLFGKVEKTRYFRTIYIVVGLAVVVYSLMRCGLGKICVISSNAPIAKLNFWERFIHIPLTINYYIKALIFPQNLAILQQWIVKDISLLTVLPYLVADIIFIGTLICIPFVIYSKRDLLGSDTKEDWFRGKYAVGKTYVFFLLWFLTGLLMHSQILPLDFTVADRWLYVPMVGILGLIGCTTLVFKLDRKILFKIIFVCVISLLCFRTYVRSLDWSDHIRLYRRDITIAPDSGPLHNNFAAELADRGNFVEAKKHLLIAYGIQPDNPIYSSNLGEVAERENNINEALYYYGISNKMGKWPYAFERKAYLLVKLNKKAEAQIYIQNALKYFPKNRKLLDLSAKL